MGTRITRLLLTSSSLRRLSRRLKQAQTNEANGDSTAVLSFDKDDEDTLDFVAASANIRSIVFGIPPRSKFDIKRESPVVTKVHQAETFTRNGWEHYTGNCNDKRDDGRIVCDASVQSYERRSAQGEKCTSVCFLLDVD